MSSFLAAKQLGRRFGVKAYLQLQRCLGRKTVEVTLRSGPRMQVRLNDHIARQILNGEGFEATIRERIRNCVQEGMTVLDIGANIGYYAVQLARWVGPTGRVVAFEPNPTMVTELETNVRLNGLRNVIIQPIALSDQTGTLEFHCPPIGQEGHGSFRPNRTFTTAARIQVPTRRLDDVLKELCLPAPNFIKMDVEGAERSVFAGARSLLNGTGKPTLVFECSETTCRAFGHCVLEVLRELADQGYALEEIDHGMWCARPHAPPC